MLSSELILQKVKEDTHSNLRSCNLEEPTQFTVLSEVFPILSSIRDRNWEPTK